jgi:hypothetical protein
MSPKKAEPPTSPPRDRKNNKGENKHKNRKVAKDGAVPESPSKKQRREDAKKKAEGVNAEYFGHLDKALKTITSKWKDIVSADPLPMVPANKGDMCGFTAAYDSEVFDAQFKQDGDALSYTCGVNFMWQNFFHSVLSHVPMYLTCVYAYFYTLLIRG